MFIPTLAGQRHLPRTLAALGPLWRERCTVIDNASVDGTADVLARFPEVRTLRNASNLGFGAAINRAVGESTAEILIVMNDDVACRPGAVDALANALTSDEGKLGMAAGVLIDEHGRVDSAGLSCDPSLASHDAFRGRNPAAIGDSDTVTGPCGGFAAYKRAAFDEVGGFDPGFFAYYEDLDLALRMQRRGWGCRLVPAAVAEHVGSATVGSRSVWKAELVGFSRGRMLAKYSTARRSRVLPWLALEAAGSLALAAELGSVRPLTARVRGYRSCKQREPYPHHAHIGRTSLSAAARERLRRRYGRPA